MTRLKRHGKITDEDEDTHAALLKMMRDISSARERKNGTEPLKGNFDHDEPSKNEHSSSADSSLSIDNSPDGNKIPDSVKSADDDKPADSNKSPDSDKVPDSNRPADSNKSPESNKPADSTWYSFRYAVKLVVTNPPPNSKRHVFDLDGGIGKRFDNLGDLSKDPSVRSDPKNKLSLHVSITPDESTWPVATLAKEKLEDLVMPMPCRQKVEYLQVGTIQSVDAEHYGLPKTVSPSDNPDPILRKNAIVARYPESNGHRLEDHFRLTTCWEFEGRQGKPCIRIGDAEASTSWSLPRILEKSNLWTSLQKNDVQNNLSKLEPKLEQALAKQRRGETKGESSMVAPKLPNMTLNKLVPELNGNSEDTKGTIAPCYVAISVVCKPETKAVDKVYPDSMYLPTPDQATVQDLRNELFKKSRDKNGNVASQADAPVLSWWIMPERGIVAPLHHICKNEYIAKYSWKAAKARPEKANKIQLYMECHFNKIIETSPAESKDGEEANE